MSDGFHCNRCGGSACEDKTPCVPMSNPPVMNKYWIKVMAVTCEQCWVAWKDMEVKIINEYRLNMLEREHRQMLKKYMHDFLDLDGTGATADAPNAVSENWKPEGQ
jgi:Fe-S cluster biosynthesis and repair protein YggX